MKTRMKRYVIIFLCVLFALGCSSGEEMDSSPQLEGVNGNGGGGDISPVIFNTPSPCMRIQGGIDIRLTIADQEGIDIIFITLTGQGLDGVVKALMGPTAPFKAVIPTTTDPTLVDGSYTLKAWVDYTGNKDSVSKQIQIRLDNDPPFTNNLLVVDSEADPLGLGDKPGAIFRIDTGTGKVCTLASSSEFSDPISIVLDPDGFLWVSDLTAKLNESPDGTGALFRVNPNLYNSVTPVITHAFFRSPVGMDIAGNTIYLADYGDATTPGAIFAVNRDSNDVTVVASDAIFKSPVGVLLNPDGGLWIVDADADPRGLGGAYGAVFSYEFGPVTEATSYSMVTPFEVVSDGVGGLILSDSGFYTMNFRGKLFRIDLAESDPLAAVEMVAYGNPFASPSGIIRTSDGLYLIADRDAGVEGLGAIIQYNPITPEVTIKYRSTLFVDPYDLVTSEK